MKEDKVQVRILFLISVNSRESPYQALPFMKLVETVASIQEE